MIYIPLHKKTEYWLYFMEQYFVFGEGGGHGVTGPRLRKIKDRIFDDQDFWEDTLFRHNAMTISPEIYRGCDPENFEHCQSNFWAMICDTLIKEGIIKIK